MQFRVLFAALLAVPAVLALPATDSTDSTQTSCQLAALHRDMATTVDGVMPTMFATALFEKALLANAQRALHVPSMQPRIVSGIEYL
ncbi:hypothetical protein LshimejAT787_0102550 [Lyophyllum shimeji]|uniref:Uncharacterized protein n=1 Tax=Lyophyllum shimeji TaxID=47721 RepID=A0A9P3UJI6_LYOSH|nr:hypothetical protein LshimejAT787_0102550 [Lyophyllum shimeji]